MNSPILTPGKCTAIALLGGLGLAAVSATMTGGTGTVVSFGGILAWLGGVAGNQVQSWFGSKLKDPQPSAEEVFHNHHIRQLLMQAIASTVEKLVPLAKEKLGGVSQTFIDAGELLGKRLSAVMDLPQGTLAELREFNVTAILTDYATRAGKTTLLSEQDWRQFLDEEPALKELRPREHEMLVVALHEHFGEALWNLVKHDAASDRQAFAAVELLYLSKILAAVQSSANQSSAPDLQPIISRISDLLSEIDQKHCSYFRSILGNLTVLSDSFDAFLASYQQGRKEDRAFQIQTTAALAALSPTILSSSPVSRYLAKLTARYAIHNTFGLPAFEAPGQKQEPDRIEDLFVQPTCTPAHTSPEAMEAALLEGRNPAIPLLPLLAQERRVVLLADPGMGKSTLVQWLVVALASATPSPEAARLGRAIPFPLMLRDLMPALGQDVSKWTWQALMQAFLAHKAGGSTSDPALAAPLADDPATLRTVLESSQAWFLLDGLDEIGDPARRLALQKVIWEGFDLYPNARWLITSRVVGYEQAPVHQKKETQKHYDSDEILIFAANSHTFHAKLLYLAPWDDRQQQDFSQHWFTQRLGTAKGGELAESFLNDVRAHASTRVLGRVPNLLLLMGLLYRYRAHLPNGRALVYQGISQAYLEGIPVARKIPHRTDKGLVPYSFAEKERLLAIIAMHMMRQRMVLGKEDEIDQDNVGEILVSEADLLSWLGPEFDSQSDKECAQELQKFLHHIADSSGLLLPRAPGVFGFAHLSFQEYYAACYLKLEFERIVAKHGRARRNLGATCATLELLSEEDFAVWAEQAVWREPLLFLVELLKGSEHFTAEIMAWLFPTLAAEPPEAPESLQAQRLLATLSIDPEAALPSNERQFFWRHLWQAHFENGDAWNATRSIAPLLLERSEHQEQVLEILVSLASNQGLKELYLDDCAGLGDLAALQNLRSLQNLSLGGCTGLSGLDALQNLTSLELLNLNGCTGLNNLDALKNFSVLHSLSLCGCTGVSSLEALLSLSSLQWLDLSGYTGVRNLDALKNLSNLQTLYLSGCTGVINLDALQNLSNLESLNLSRCTGLINLNALQNLSRLQQLNLSRCTGVENLEKQIEGLKRALPECRIYT